MSSVDNMSYFLDNLLKHYQMTAEDLERRKAPGSFIRLKRPDGLPAFENVIQRLEKAINSQEKTVIYGDYDVDGLTSTAVLYLGLLVAGLKVGYFIPSRYVEGYGLNKDRITQFAEKGYKLIVTVDNGISCHEQIEYAKSLGLEVIVIDHHACPETLPNTPYIFHQTNSGFLDYNCSAASLAFFVSSRLMKKDEPYLATLAGIAVFSDVMPLVGNNLEMAKLCLQSLNQYRYTNLLSLMEGDISYDSINFNLIPALNSPGRIAKDSLSTNHACQFLLSQKPESVLKYSAFLKELNNKRKELVKNVKFVEGKTFESEHAIVLTCEDYAGLAGLFANRVMREKNKPSLIFAPSENDESLLIGSLRLPEGFSSKKFLSNTYFVACGGHERAAGLTIKSSDYFKAMMDFVSDCEKQALEKRADEEDLIPLDLEDINKANYKTFEMFQPFGEGFPSPKFAVSFAKEDVTFSKNHNAAFVYPGNKEGKVVYFGPLDDFESPLYSLYTVIGTLRQETFRDNSTVSLLGEKLISEE